MEIKLKEKDILKLIKKEFGEETTIEEMEKEFIIIDVDMFAFNNGGSDSSFRDKKEELSKPVSKENQKLTEEQERYIRMEMARYGGTGKDYARSPKMDAGNRTIEQHSSEPVKRKSNVMIDKNSKSIIDGVK